MKAEQYEKDFLNFKTNLIGEIKNFFVEKQIEEIVLEEAPVLNYFGDDQFSPLVRKINSNGLITVDTGYSNNYLTIEELDIDLLLFILKAIEKEEFEIF
jgi:hypothetical protein